VAEKTHDRSRLINLKPRIDIDLRRVLSTANPARIATTITKQACLDGNPNSLGCMSRSSLNGLKSVSNHPVPHNYLFI
jgi:hypothetical protein